jgi:hypothetical protein
MAKIQRFNPPPNWPTPPEGWSPPPNWQPDPSWGQSPEGWQYWVSERANPRAWVFSLVSAAGLYVVFLVIALVATGGALGASGARGPVFAVPHRRHRDGRCGVVRAVEVADLALPVGRTRNRHRLHPSVLDRTNRAEQLSKGCWLHCRIAPACSYALVRVPVFLDPADEPGSSSPSPTTASTSSSAAGPCSPRRRGRGEAGSSRSFPPGDVRNTYPRSLLVTGGRSL